jgi:hypothetical protein
MRLYRGLKTPYRPDKVGADAWRSGTDFTDCPFTALRYASTSRGVVLVLEIFPGLRLRVTEELWPGVKAKRLMVWGRFDHALARSVAAKELRAQIRRKGILGQSDAYKASVLTSYVDRLLADERSRVADGGLAAR